MTAYRGNAAEDTARGAAPTRESWGDFLVGGGAGGGPPGRPVHRERPRIPDGRSVAPAVAAARRRMVRLSAHGDRRGALEALGARRGLRSAWQRRAGPRPRRRDGEARRERAQRAPPAPEWNEEERRWHVWTDRFGTVHAYYATDGERASLGTHFPAVAEAASRRRLDWDGLAGFFAFGFFPQDRTFFEDVRILRPASHVVFDETGRLVSSERYWNWSHRPDARRSYAQTVEAFAATLHEVLDEQVRGRLAVPISGGLDSRTTVAALTGPGRTSNARCGRIPTATPTPRKTRIARRVGGGAQPAVPRPDDPSLSVRRAGAGARCVEGFQDVTQTRQVSCRGSSPRRPTRWSRRTGETSGWTAWGRERPRRPRRWPTMRSPRSPSAAGLATGRSSRRAGGSPRTLCCESSSPGELERFAGLEDPDFRVKAFKTEQWSFRWTLASIRMFQAGAFPRLPSMTRRFGAVRRRAHRFR